MTYLLSWSFRHTSHGIGHTPSSPTVGSVCLWSLYYCPTCSAGFDPMFAAEEGDRDSACVLLSSKASCPRKTLATAERNCRQLTHPTPQFSLLAIRAISWLAWLKLRKGRMSLCQPGGHGRVLRSRSRQHTHVRHIRGDSRRRIVTDLVARVAETLRKSIRRSRVRTRWYSFSCRLSLCCVALQPNFCSP